MIYNIQILAEEKYVKKYRVRYTVSVHRYSDLVSVMDFTWKKCSHNPEITHVRYLATILSEGIQYTNTG